MAVSLVATGITFPDLTTQTTAAVSGLTAASPGVAKAWMKANPAGFDPLIINASHNVSSWTYNSNGIHTVTLITSFSSNAYCVVTAGGFKSGYYTSVSVDQQTSSGFRTVSHIGQNQLLASDVFFAAFGS